MPATSLCLPDDIEKPLDTFARQAGHSKAFYFIEAIREHLGDLEDIYIAEKRLAEARVALVSHLRQIWRRY